jgi:hypothetical protein
MLNRENDGGQKVCKRRTHTGEKSLSNVIVICAQLAWWESNYINNLVSVNAPLIKVLSASYVCDSGSVGWCVYISLGIVICRGQVAQGCIVWIWMALLLAYFTVFVLAASVPATGQQGMLFRSSFFRRLRNSARPSLVLLLHACFSKQDIQNYFRLLFLSSMEVLWNLRNIKPCRFWVWPSLS